MYVRARACVRVYVRVCMRVYECMHACVRVPCSFSQTFSKRTAKQRGQINVKFPDWMEILTPEPLAKEWSSYD